MVEGPGEATASYFIFERAPLREANAPEKRGRGANGINLDHLELEERQN